MFRVLEFKAVSKEARPTTQAAHSLPLPRIVTVMRQTLTDATNLLLRSPVTPGERRISCMSKHFLCTAKHHLR